MKVKPFKIEPVCRFCGKCGGETVLIHADRNINEIGDVCVTKWCSNCGMADIAYYRNWSHLHSATTTSFVFPS